MFAIRSVERLQIRNKENMMIFNKFEGFSYVDEFDNIVEVKSTYKIQMRSLLDFAKALGYFLEYGLNFSYMFDGDVTDKKVVSFNTMVKWHNTCFMHGFSHSIDEELFNQSKRLNLCALRMGNAIDNKLVKQVHLQLKKGKKHRLPKKNTEPEIQVLSHMIKFA